MSHPKFGRAYSHAMPVCQSHHGAWVRYTWREVDGNAFADRAQVEIDPLPNGGQSGLLAESELVFDHFGRFWRERRRLGSGLWSPQGELITKPHDTR